MHERARPSRSGRGHALAMTVGCVASIVALVLIFAVGLPRWLIVAALLACPAVLAASALLNRGQPNPPPTPAERDQNTTPGTVDPSSSTPSHLTR